MDASDIDDLVTHIDQLKSDDPKVNQALMKVRNVLEKCKARLLSGKDKEGDEAMGMPAV